MVRVILESPFQGRIPRNLEYLRRAIADCIKRGESPYASHKMIPGALNDLIPEERELGIKAGFTWHSAAEKSVVYEDYGISAGMVLGIENATILGLPIEYRKIGENPQNA